MKKIASFIIFTGAIAALQSCSKSFLDKPPIDQVTSGNFYTTDAEVAAGTAPLYNIVWFDYNDKAFLAFGEARGGTLNSNDRTAFIQFAPSATDQSTLLPGYKSFYKIISQSNVTIQSINASTTGTVTAGAKNTALGECRFMRATAYYYLLSNWGAVPIIYDNITQLNQPLHRNTISDV